MPRTILYARTSTGRQTIALQREAAEAAGFVLDEVIADEEVSGVSTRLAERDGGRRLHAILLRGDTLVLNALDRLGRSYADVTGAMRDFMERGVVVRTVADSLHLDGALTDPRQRAARDSLIALAAASAEERAVIDSERIRSAKRAQRARGVYGGGTRPFGFDVLTVDNERRLVPNAAEQAALADMKARRAAGESFAKIGAAHGKLAMSVKRILDKAA